MRRIFALTVLCAITSPCFADVIGFTTMNYAGPDLYDTENALLFSGGASPAGHKAYAFQFEPTITGTLTRVRWALGYVEGTNNTNLEFASDLNNQIGPWHFRATISVSNPAPAIYQVSYDGTPGAPMLHVGQKYWITYYGTPSNNSIKKAFMAESVMPHLRMGTSTSPGVFTYEDDQLPTAFEIYMDPVPEPATMTALGLGAAALLARRRRKKA